MTEWHPSACILCECNCGIEILLGEDQQTFTKIRGDKQHPASAGYTCNKALQLDHYQNGRTERLTTPLRRRADGGFEPVDWDTAIADIATRLKELPGESIFYYGGGGQGNHLGGAYSPATMAAFGAKYRSSALAQEKTGEFWVSARMMGTITRADFEHCEVAVFIGKNPYQSHGFPRARAVLKEIARDAQRSMIVIDPVRTETAALADLHLQVKPGMDLWLLTAMAAVLVQEDLVDHGFIQAHIDGYDEVAQALSRVPVAAYSQRADVPEEQVREASRRIAHASSVAVFEDLGVQMNHNSTVVSYVEKLLWLLTGNFGKPGSQYIPSGLSNIGRDRGYPVGEGPRSPVVGAPIISGLVPCNVIADEILTDHPDRYRAMIVESSNPAHSLADSARMRQALNALDLLVVIDVAMTETARLADYVLPTPTQFEKYECTFFTFDFPRNIFHLRHPVLPAPEGLLAEPEIHARLVEASGALGENDYQALRAAAVESRGAFAQAFLPMMADPRYRRLAPVLLYRTLGPSLSAPAAAVLWAAAHQTALANADGVRRAGYGQGLEAGERLFDAILAGSHGITTTVDEWQASWQRLPRDRMSVLVPELLAVVSGLSEKPAEQDSEFPFVLSAGERRAFTANTIMRDPTWRRREAAGDLRMSQGDADRMGINSGDRVVLTTRCGQAEVTVQTTGTMRPGHLALPNGFGLTVDGQRTGIAPNDLTRTADRDEFVGTPWHKHVPARVEKVVG